MSNLKMMFRLFDRIKEEYFRYCSMSNFMEFDSKQAYISEGLKETSLNSFLGRVCASVDGFTPGNGLNTSVTTYFFLMGCSPSWYLSGRTEFTLLISKNLMFLMGLLKVYYLGSRLPLLEMLTVLEEVWLFYWALGVDDGRVCLKPSIYYMFISIYSGLLYEPD